VDRKYSKSIGKIEQSRLNFNSSMPPSTGIGTVGAAINDFFFQKIAI